MISLFALRRVILPFLFLHNCISDLLVSFRSHAGIVYGLPWKTDSTASLIDLKMVKKNEKKAPSPPTFPLQVGCICSIKRQVPVHFCAWILVQQCVWGQANICYVGAWFFRQLILFQKKKGIELAFSFVFRGQKAHICGCWISHIILKSQNSLTVIN